MQSLDMSVWDAAGRVKSSWESEGGIFGTGRAATPRETEETDTCVRCACCELVQGRDEIHFGRSVGVDCDPLSARTPFSFPRLRHGHIAVRE